MIFEGYENKWSLSIKSSFFLSFLLEQNISLISLSFLFFCLWKKKKWVINSTSDTQRERKYLLWCFNNCNSFTIIIQQCKSETKSRLFLVSKSWLFNKFFLLTLRCFKLFKEVSHTSTTMIVFCFFAKLYIVLSLWRFPNKCPNRVIMILKKHILMFKRVHSNPCISKTSWLKTGFFALRQRFRYEQDT